MTSPRILLAALLLAAGIAGGAWFLSGDSPFGSGEPDRATVLPIPLPLSDFALTDHNGEPFTRASLQGGWHLLFFGFTHCPDICPATLQQLAIVRQRLAEAGHAPLPDIVMVSVDPERDTTEALARYVSNFGDGIKGVTGRYDQLQALAKPLGIFYEYEPADDDGNYNISHSVAVLVIDPQAELKALFSAPHDIAAFVSDIPLVVSAQ